jgi:hypothetical protein
VLRTGKRLTEREDDDDDDDDDDDNDDDDNNVRSSIRNIGCLQIFSSLLGSWQ